MKRSGFFNISCFVIMVSIVAAAASAPVHEATPAALSLKSTGAGQPANAEDAPHASAAAQHFEQQPAGDSTQAFSNPVPQPTLVQPAEPLSPGSSLPNQAATASVTSDSTQIEAFLGSLAPPTAPDVAPSSAGTASDAVDPAVTSVTTAAVEANVAKDSFASEYEKVTRTQPVVVSVSATHLDGSAAAAAAVSDSATQAGPPSAPLIPATQPFEQESSPNFAAAAPTAAATTEAEPRTALPARAAHISAEAATQVHDPILMANGTVARAAAPSPPVQKVVLPLGGAESQIPVAAGAQSGSTIGHYSADDVEAHSAFALPSHHPDSHRQRQLIDGSATGAEVGSDSNYAAADSAFQANGGVTSSNLAKLPTYRRQRFHNTLISGRKRMKANAASLSAASVGRTSPNLRNRLGIVSAWFMELQAQAMGSTQEEATIHNWSDVGSAATSWQILGERLTRLNFGNANGEKLASGHAGTSDYWSQSTSDAMNSAAEPGFHASHRKFGEQQLVASADAADHSGHLTDLGLPSWTSHSREHAVAIGFFLLVALIVLLLACRGLLVSHGRKVYNGGKLLVRNPRSDIMFRSTAIEEAALPVSWLPHSATAPHKVSADQHVQVWRAAGWRRRAS